MIVIVLASITLFIVNKIGQEKFSGYIWSCLEAAGTLLMGICPFILTWMYDPEIPWMKKLNSLLSNRLALQKKVVAEEGFSLFGKPIQWTGWGGYDGTDKPDYNYVDCSFMRDTFDRGISFEVIFLTGCTFLYFFLNKKKDVTGSILMFFFLLSALVEDHIIMIQLNRNGRKIDFSITNDGAKIEKKDLDKIWDIFYTTDKARTDRMSSSGVGLSVVKSILDVHKADYGCTSGDNGTEFKFSLPAYEPA